MVKKGRIQGRISGGSPEAVSGARPPNPPPPDDTAPPPTAITPTAYTPSTVISTPSAPAPERPRFDFIALRRFLAQVLDPSVGPIEMRVILGHFSGWDEDKITDHPKFGTTLAGWFDDAEQLLPWAAKLDGISGYLCFNPADKSLLDRAKNKLVKQRSTTTDKDVSRLRWWFLDIDSKRTKGVSATDAELAGAVALRDQILADHPDLATSSLWGKSGNGCWILTRIDYPNDAESRALVVAANTSMVARYQTDYAEIDPAAKNASRIGPLVGTAKCKGEHTAERPWRSVTFDGACGRPLEWDPALFRYPADSKPLPFDLVAWLTANPAPEPKPRAKPIPGARPTSATAPEDWPRERKLQRAIAYVAALDGAVAHQGGHNQTFDAACAIVLGFLLDGEDAREILHTYNERCQPPWAPWEIEHKLEEAYKKLEDPSVPRGYLLVDDRPPGDDGGLAYAPPPTTFAFTDDGNARRLVAHYGDRIRYATDLGEWMAFDGTRWVRNAEIKVRDLARSISDLVPKEIPPTSDAELIASYMDWGRRSASKKAMSDMIWVAASDPSISCRISDFDKDKNLLNCPDGTIDLRKGEVRPHDPADMITRMTAVACDSAATSPLWDKYLKDALVHPEVIAFADQWMGYSLTGETSDQYFPIQFGPGGNGKDVLSEVALAILGDYGTVADPDLFREMPSGKHPAGLDAIRGKRFVAIQESNQQTKLDEAMIKRITGSGTLTARGMHQDFSTFLAEAKFFYMTNHPPKLQGTDQGLWRRMLKIDWPTRFLDREDYDKYVQSDPSVRLADKSLRARMIDEERPAILARWIKAAQQWYGKPGLVIPDRIRVATQDYRQELDTVERFIVAQCDRIPGAETAARSLYRAYRDWMHSEVEHGQPISETAFGISMNDKGHRKNPNNRTHSWRMGIRLRVESGNNPEGL